MDQQTARSAIHALDLYMNPGMFRHEESLHKIGEALAAGRLVVIRNAAREVFAEKMFHRLDWFSDWRVYECYEEHFHYHHHNIYEKRLYPQELAWCNTLFASEPTKALMQRLSRRDCAGETSFSASWYLPGDHSLPHSDDVTVGENCSRQVAFVWHLAKGWNSTWGGAFYWCPSDRYLAPAFNTLMLFTVGPHSRHFVTQVSPFAQSKRLAINGWWPGKPDPTPATPRRKDPDGEGVFEIVCL
jgi:Rps23 Pro-64 3,4-dihydroxylase Tpa1-like proline 4-hydroxylase